MKGNPNTKKEDAKLVEMAKAKGAVGFMSQPHESTRLFLSSSLLLFSSSLLLFFQFLFLKIFSDPFTHSFSSGQKMKQEDDKGTDIRELAKAKGAVGFLSFDSDSSSLVPPKKDERAASPSLFRKTKDDHSPPHSGSPHGHGNEKGTDIRELAKAKGAVGFMSFDNDSSSLVPPKKDERAASPSLFRKDKSDYAPPHSGSPHGHGNEKGTDIRELAKAKGAVGFLSVDTVSPNQPPKRVTDSVSPSPMRPRETASPLARPREGDIRELVKAKGAVGFLSSDIEEELPTSKKSNDQHHVSPLGMELHHAANDPANTQDIRQLAKAKGAVGFMYMSEMGR